MASEWRPIAEPPAEKMAVLLYFANLEWPEVDPVRAHGWNVAVGWYSDKHWFESGTGHDCFEEWMHSDQHPTHWMPLPPALGAA